MDMIYRLEPRDWLELDGKPGAPPAADEGSNSSVDSGT
jgi:hypothetical protein